MAGYFSIEVPRETVNDDTVLLIEWLIEDGKEVDEGEPICILESSKATFDLPAPCAGYLFQQKNAGENVPVGEVIAVVAPEPVRPQPERVPDEVLTPTAATPPAWDIERDDRRQISVKALQLIRQHKIDAAVFDGIGLVREKNVLEYLKGQKTVPSKQDARLLPHTKVQMQTAKVVSRSKQSIPHSHLTRHVLADSIDLVVESMARARDIILSASDWLVWCVARTLREHPKANATWTEEGLVLHEDIHVGFTLSQTDGTIVVPVIKNANALDVGTIAGMIRGFQKKSLRHTLAPGDLADGHCTITSLIGSGIHQVMPIIYPDQAVILAIADRWGIGVHMYYSLTIAFDHRILNGMEAGMFLNDVVDRLSAGGEEGA